MRDWLRAKRTEAGLTMKEMGDKLGISESYYSMIESGDRQKKMDVTLAAGLSAALNMPIAEIIARDNAPEN